MNNITTNKSHESSKAEQWAFHIKRWEESMLSQPEYCKQAGISYAAFGYWRSKLSSDGKASTVNFVPVSVTAKKSSVVEAPKSIQIKLVSGHLVYIPTTLPVADIAALIAAIGVAHA